MCIRDRPRTEEQYVCGLRQYTMLYVVRYTLDSPWSVISAKVDTMYYPSHFKLSNNKYAGYIVGGVSAVQSANDSL